MNTRADYFTAQPTFRFNANSVYFFVVVCLVAWGLHILGQSVFPATHTFPYVARTLLTLLVDGLFMYASIRLIRLNGLPQEAMGLSPQKGLAQKVIIGLLIGFVIVGILAMLIGCFVPYHIVTTPVPYSSVLKDALSYAAVNTLEELTFRGFLFIIISQLWGWRPAWVIMAFLFGLFHLPGYGVSGAGAKMVMSTFSFGLVFGCAYVYTKSLWAAIATHISANICLHLVWGLDGAHRALLDPVFERTWPAGYDLGLMLTLVAAALTTGVLYWLIVRRISR